MNKLLFPLFLALLLIYSCQPSLPTAALLIFNGEIYTVDSLGKVEAVAVKDGKILATGRLKELEQYKGEKTEEIDLQGKTMIPGFFICYFTIPFSIKITDFLFIIIFNQY